MRSAVAVILVLALGACSSGAEPGRGAGPEGAPPWEPDRRCVAHDDCRPAPSCCPRPCTHDVIHVKDLDRAYREMRRTCPSPPPDCPQAGSCPGHAYLCLEGTCALVMEGDPAYPAAP
jgi:hypothetical protein